MLLNRKNMLYHTYIIIYSYVQILRLNGITHIGISSFRPTTAEQPEVAEK